MDHKPRHSECQPIRWRLTPTLTVLWRNNIQFCPKCQNSNVRHTIDQCKSIGRKPLTNSPLGPVIASVNREKMYGAVFLPQGITTAPYIFSRFTLAITPTYLASPYSAIRYFHHLPGRPGLGYTPPPPHTHTPSPLPLPPVALLVWNHPLSRVRRRTSQKKTSR